MTLQGFKQHKIKNLEAHLARERKLLQLFQFTWPKDKSPRIRKKSGFYIKNPHLESVKYQQESAQLQQQLAKSLSNSQQKPKKPSRQSDHQPPPSTASPLPRNNQSQDQPALSASRQRQQIFLTHTHEHSEKVWQLYQLLQQKGYQPWLNKFDLIPGHNWRSEIPRVLENSKLLITCLSKTSLKKQGYVPTELQLAFHEYAKRPSGSIYLIPLKLDNCQPPDFQLPELEVNLQELQWLDYWKPNGVENLIETIKFFLVQYFS